MWVMNEYCPILVQTSDEWNFPAKIWEWHTALEHTDRVSPLNKTFTWPAFTFLFWVGEGGFSPRPPRPPPTPHYQLSYCSWTARPVISEGKKIGGVLVSAVSKSIGDDCEAQVSTWGLFLLLPILIDSIVKQELVTVDFSLCYFIIILASMYKMNI